MKVHELAKKLGFKAPELLQKAKELGLTPNGIGAILKDGEEDILTHAFSGMEPTRVEKVEVPKLDLVPYELKKGAFIGIVFNGDKFVIASVTLTLEQVKKYEHELISEHTSINGALIEINKHITKKVNVNTVKSFPKEEK